MAKDDEDSSKKIIEKSSSLKEEAEAHMDAAKEIKKKISLYLRAVA